MAAVHALNVSAFESPVEANIVDTLRKQAHPIVSLVAEDNRTVVGHIMFSPVSLSGHPELKIMGLAPMAVAHTHQNKGIGTALVRSGLEQCKVLGYGAVVVLGHPDYYPRFGFSPSTHFGIGCEFEAPAEAFMLSSYSRAISTVSQEPLNIMLRSATYKANQAKSSSQTH